MDYYGRIHEKKFHKIAEEAAAFARDKPSREIKSVPHIKLTKSQLEFILKMPKPIVKWFEHGWVTYTSEEDELYQKLMDEKNINAALKNNQAKLIKAFNDVNKIAWYIRDKLKGGSFRGRIKSVTSQVEKIISNLARPIKKRSLNFAHVTDEHYCDVYDRDAKKWRCYYRYDRKLTKTATEYIEEKSAGSLVRDIHSDSLYHLLNPTL